MTHIYALVSGQLVLYVGQTVRTLKRREYDHRRSSNECHSRYIPDYIDWQIKLLETVEDEQALIKEQYYYDILKPFYNHIRPLQTRKEYRNNHFKDRQEYYNKHKDSEQYLTYNQSERRKALKLEQSRTEHAIQQRKEYRLKLKQEKNNVTAK